LPPIVVVPKKNGTLGICIDFRKLNVATKKDPYPLPFIDEMLNTIARYKAYSGYHQIAIVLEDRYKIAFDTDWGAFIWKGDAIWSEKWTSNI
jgi:putative transposase